MLTIEKIKQISDKIVNAIHPEKVVLFGSYAYGVPKESSDLDLLVIIQESKLPRFKRSREIYKLLWGITPVSKDIVVYTKEEIDEWKNVDLAFITYILKKGKILYEK